MKASASRTPIAQGTYPRLSSLAPLPPTLTSFIGRADLLDEVESTLRTEHSRLVTLVGPGGVGKTRLAIELAGRIGDSYSNGVGYVSLASIMDPGLVLQAIALRLGVREGDRQSLLERICNHFDDGTNLLIVDNYEQVVTSAPTLIELLGRCPRLSIVVTSRSPLHVSAERVIPVPPLGVPDQGATSEAAATESVQLFVERAEAIRPGITRNEDLAPVIGEICQRLDGMPLAIELAAARTAALPLPSLLNRLTTRLPVLVSGPRDQPARLQTMRNAIAWSYDLLTPGQQATFRMLSAFVGGFSLDAAEAMDGESGRDVLDDIEALIDQSLVQAVPEVITEPRYRMLETIREFGLEQLSGTGEEEAVRKRYAAYFLAKVEHLDPLVDVSGESALGPLDLDRPNILAALTWLARQQRAEESLRMSAAMWRYWRIRGFLSEGRNQLHRALNLTGMASPAARGEVLWKLGYMEFYLGREREAREYLERAVGLFEAAGDDAGLATAIDALGAVARHQRDLALAARCHQRAYEVRGELGDAFGQAMPLASLGMLALDRGEIDVAQRLLSEAFDLTVAHGSGREIAHRQLNLAHLEDARAHLDAARTHARAALDTFESLGDPVASTSAHDLLGRIAARSGDNDAATRHFGESLQIRLRLGLHRDLVDIVRQIAMLMVSVDASLAIRMMGAIDANQSQGESLLFEQDDPAWQQVIADARAALGPAAFALAWQEGRALTIPVAARKAEGRLLDLALSDPAPNAPADPDQKPSASPLAPLTRRELEILRLVAAGHTNRAIAATLFISPATVKRHVTNILTKLNLPTRAAAISFALRNHLLDSLPPL